MEVYVIVGYNKLTQEYGAVGVADTLERAEQIAREHEDTLDGYDIQNFELNT
jgi:hypothetical protein